jgi:RHS repeat-associated protein
MGTLIDGMRDNSGHMYMRNRYYDPSTGRFTQEDPIGLAGGINAYGFANGDPVSYRDSYGLSPDGCDPPGSCLVRRTYQGAAVGFAGGVGIAGACVLLTSGACAAGPAEAKVVQSTAAGALAGTAVGTAEEIVSAAKPVIDSGVHQMGRFGRWVRRTAGGVLISIGVTTQTPTTDSAAGQIPDHPTEAEPRGRRAPRKEGEGQRPPND